MGRNRSRMSAVKNQEDAAQASFFDMFRKFGFYATLARLTLEPIPRSVLYSCIKNGGSLNEYYRIEYYLTAHNFIEFSIDTHGTEIMVRLTEKGLELRNRIDEINNILRESE